MKAQDETTPVFPDRRIPPSKCTRAAACPPVCSRTPRDRGRGGRDAMPCVPAAGALKKSICPWRGETVRAHSSCGRGRSSSRSALHGPTTPLFRSIRLYGRHSACIGCGFRARAAHVLRPSFPGRPAPGGSAGGRHWPAGNAAFFFWSFFVTGDDYCVESLPYNTVNQ